MALLHDKGEEDAIVRRASDTVGTFRAEEIGPGLGWHQVGVVDVKQRQDSPRAGPESVEGAMLSIPEENKRGGISSCCNIHGKTF